MFSDFFTCQIYLFVFPALMQQFFLIYGTGFNGVESLTFASRMKRQKSVHYIVTLFCQFTTLIFIFISVATLHLN